MRNKKYFALSLIYILSLLIIPASISGADLYENPIAIISPVNSALGGPHTTMNNGFSSLMNNPAGFYTAKPEFSIAEITLG